MSLAPPGGGQHDAQGPPVLGVRTDHSGLLAPQNPQQVLPWYFLMNERMSPRTPRTTVLERLVAVTSRT